MIGLDLRHLDRVGEHVEAGGAGAARERGKFITDRGGFGFSFPRPYRHRLFSPPYPSGPSRPGRPLPSYAVLRRQKSPSRRSERGAALLTAQRSRA